MPKPKKTMDNINDGTLGDSIRIPRKIEEDGDTNQLQSSIKSLKRKVASSKDQLDEGISEIHITGKLNRDELILNSLNHKVNDLGLQMKEVLKLVLKMDSLEKKINSLDNSVSNLTVKVNDLKTGIATTNDRIKSFSTIKKLTPSSQEKEMETRKVDDDPGKLEKGFL